jgi:hypothetical protein
VGKASDEIFDIRQNLMVQLKRMAQIQQQLDQVTSVLKKKFAT